MSHILIHIYLLCWLPSTHNDDQWIIIAFFVSLIWTNLFLAVSRQTGPAYLLISGQFVQPGGIFPLHRLWISSYWLRHSQLSGSTVEDQGRLLSVFHPAGPGKSLHHHRWQELLNYWQKGETKRKCCSSTINILRQGPLTQLHLLRVTFGSVVCVIL